MENKKYGEALSFRVPMGLKERYKKLDMFQKKELSVDLIKFLDNKIKKNEEDNNVRKN